MAAFAGEAEANRKYTAYAKKAEKDGKMNAAKLFRAAADAETLHAVSRGINLLNTNIEQRRFYPAKIYPD